ncbi:MAG: amino acid permease [Phycisphaerales bacterium]|nr:amino acid permease [Phycisphaerales bacterium]
MKLFDITMVGVGAMIGAGIFALTGIAAGKAGPALLLAFCLNGVLTFCTAMVYAEVGSAIPAAGGGYLWARFGLPGPCAFLAGWMDWLAHAVAGSLYAVIFGAYTVWGLQVIFNLGVAPTGAHAGDLGTLFGIPAWPIAKALTVFICVGFIYINYRGSSETGKAGNIITVAKVVVIGIFIVSGLIAMMQGSGQIAAGDPTIGDRFMPFMPEGFSGVLVAMGLTFIAFEGYEIIVQAGEEVENPRRNIPKAIFLSLVIVIPIYILVAIVSLGALSIPESVLAEQMATDTPWRAADTWRYLAGLGETGVAVAANSFMPWGTGAILLVIGALLSTMSALNATTFSSTRVSFAMGRDHYLPDAMATISPKTKTPVFALLASGVLITLVAVLLPVEEVAAATCVMFLLVFAAVNIASITIRRKYGDKLNYGYIVPGYPIVPIVAAVGQLAIAGFLFYYEPMSLAITGGWVGIGLLIYYLYSRRQEHEYRASAVLFEQSAPADASAQQLLIPVANPATTEPLMQLASRLATIDSTRVTALHVVGLPEQLPYASAAPFTTEGRRVVDLALGQAHELGLQADGLVRLSRSPGQSIVETIHERKISTLLMGWGGPRRSRSMRSIMIGTEIDHVLRKADANTIVLRGTLPDAPKKIMIPAANPKQSKYAVAVAEALAGPGSVIELVHIVRNERDAESSKRALMGSMFGEEMADLPSVYTERKRIEVTVRTVVSTHVIPAIVEAIQLADMVILGAARETWWQRRSFTALHAAVAKRYDGPLLLVKLRTGVARFATQQVVDFFMSKEPEA